MITTFSKQLSADHRNVVGRPNKFLAGTVKNQKKPVTILRGNKRVGLGNRNIDRVNFERQSIKPRIVRLPTESIVEIGRPASVTDTRLSNKTVVRVPDMTDFEWLNEKARLTRLYTARFAGLGRTAAEIAALVENELRINKPLGREQRTITKESDDITNDRDLNAKQKMNEILQEIQNGRADNINDRRAITAQLVQLLTYAGNIEQLGRQQLAELGNATHRLGVPVRYKDLGFPNDPKYVDYAFYRANSGIINLYMLSLAHRDIHSQPPGPRTYNEPVLRVVQNNISPITNLLNMVDMLRRRRYYLDMTQGMLIPETDLLEIARRSYNDDFTHSDFNIALNANGRPV